ncbi:uncharacterized protein LOC126323258 [Schistocerca gregaria]|uniref:uncharacterized protein LOC126323258 n=1 Tax=Schistocerca gregaria TaxID=7010 RepID=UPI00211E82E8|nr:uncharacterized protein LOC126323258 [Schistocerca gregaria]
MATPIKFEQVAGHPSSMVRLRDGKIAKRTIEREAEFYKHIFDSGSSFSALVPKFYGVEEVDGHPCIIIEDLTAGFSKPSIMDVKLGSTSADPRDGILKQISMKSKDLQTTTSTLGIRICGMSKHDIKENKVIRRDKSWGKSISQSSMLDALKSYFLDGYRIRTDVISGFIRELEKHLSWWEHNSEFHLISASLLFIYESDPVRSTKVVVKMIDLAHSIYPKKKENQVDILFGLDNLINFFNEILDNVRINRPTFAS